MDAGASTETVSYNQRDLLIYALGIGAPELKFIHEDAEDFSAFPTYPLALAFKGDSADVVPFPPASLGSLLGSLDGVTVAVDAECSIESLAPLPTRGGSFALRTEVCGIEPKASGALVYSESELISSSGESLARIRSAVFAVGVRAATRQGVSFSERVPTPTRKADAEVSETITEQQAHIYRLSGDYNPLHVCPEVAKMSGFERPILHGRCTLGFSTRHVLRRFAGNDPARLRFVRARFAGPICPGETLLTRMWQEEGRVVFEALVKDKVVLSHAYARIEPIQVAKL